VNVVVAEDIFLGAAVADAGDHRRVIAGVGKHRHVRQFARQGRQRRVIGHIARSENQCRFAPVQVGELVLEQQVHLAVAGIVAGAAGAGADRP
jgi:hypothetical protein